MAEPTQQELLDRVGDRTVCDLFMDACRDHPTKTALVDRASGVVRKQTWADYQRLTSQVAMGLRSLGVEHGERVAIMASNRPEHPVADVGALLAGATPISVYNTLAPDQTAYVAGDAAVKVAIVEDEYLEKWRSIRDDLPALETIVTLDAAPKGDGEISFDDLLARGAEALKTGEGEFENAWRSVRPEDICTIIYTSGTTGPPKGVQISHGNMIYQMAALDAVVQLPTNMAVVSYLPLAHVAERMMSHYSAMLTAAEVEFVPDVKKILEALVGTRPQAMMAVPRVWEKLHAGVMANLAAEDERRRNLIMGAINNGIEASRLRSEGKPVPLGMRIKHELAERVIFSKLRAKLGLDRCEIRLSGAAPISADLMHFYTAIGLSIIEVYGMTESTAVISANRPGEERIGSVGRATIGTELKIAEDGEILSRGPHVMPGYLNRPEANAEAIDADGWLHTGDLGALDADGYLTITGRKKELIITSSGKNLSPNNIEETIKPKSDIIAAVCALGDDQPFIAALVVLDAEVLPGWCASNGIDFTSLAELAENEQVVAEVQRAVDEGNEDLARIEQVKKFQILGEEWLPGSEEMTPTMKLKRSIIHTKYSDVIDTLYG